MRTALVLLFMLALAAVPGSIIPKENIDSVRVGTWKAAHPALTPIYDRLGLFHVFGSAWFSAVYILLMVSLVGCVVPRLRIYWRALRAQPPRVPRNLGRLPQSRTFELAEDQDVVLARASAVLRRRRYRVVVHPADHGGALSGEGLPSRAGNLLFHLSVLVVLVGFAVGQLFGFKGGVITIVGQGFSNTLSQYDDFAPGSLFDPGKLSPLSLKVDHFHVSWLTSGPEMGQPRSFDANITLPHQPSRGTEGVRPRREPPAQRGGHRRVPGRSRLRTRGHGAQGMDRWPTRGPPCSCRRTLVLLVRGGQGPGRGTRAARVPGVLPPDVRLHHHGAEALLPVPRRSRAGALASVPYHGNLGLDSGKPQSVYTLDKARLRTFPSSDPTLGPVRRIKLVRGPDGHAAGRTGSIHASTACGAG